MRVIICSHEADIDGMYSASVALMKYPGAKLSFYNYGLKNFTKMFDYIKKADCFSEKSLRIMMIKKILMITRRNPKAVRKNGFCWRFCCWGLLPCRWAPLWRRSNSWGRSRNTKKPSPLRSRHRRHRHLRFTTRSNRQNGAAAVPANGKQVPPKKASQSNKRRRK